MILVQQPWLILTQYYQRCGRSTLYEKLDAFLDDITSSEQVRVPTRNQVYTVSNLGKDRFALGKKLCVGSIKEYITILLCSTNTYYEMGIQVKHQWQ